MTEETVKKFLSQISRKLVFSKRIYLLQVTVSQLSARVPVGMVAGGLVVRSVGGSVGGGGVGSAM